MFFLVLFQSKGADFIVQSRWILFCARDVTFWECLYAIYCTLCIFVLVQVLEYCKELVPVVSRAPFLLSIDEMTYTCTVLVQYIDCPFVCSIYIDLPEIVKAS